MTILRIHTVALACIVAFSTLFSRAAESTEGRFIRTWWFQPGAENGNPGFNSRFRVNAPEVVIDERFHHRNEPRGSGCMFILAEEDLTLLDGAELYAELWGGHPGTANKRVTLNGRTTYHLPRAGVEEGRCAHQYPTIPLKITDLVNGYNAAQWACDTGTTFWGHFIVDNAAIRTFLPRDHPALVERGLSDFEGSVQSRFNEREDRFELQLSAPENFPASEIRSVEFHGSYYGYDENGDGDESGWHGFTKNRVPQAILGLATTAPWKVEWDVSMLPAQAGVSVRAVVRFDEDEAIEFQTAALGGLIIPARSDAAVSLHGVPNLPDHFWSRANRKKSVSIPLEMNMDDVVGAELHVVVWDGGAGTVKDYFTLNGRSLPVADRGRHVVIYTKTRIDPKMLRSGMNVIELLSDTDHHGIEVLAPGPALMIRRKL